VAESSARVKNGREASLEVNHAVAAEVLGLLIGNALQRAFGLHHGDRVGEALQVLGKVSLVCAPVEPGGQLVGIYRGKRRVSRLACQFDDGLRTEHAVEVLVQEHLGKGLE
jgi:hypothetical protein